MEIFSELPLSLIAVFAFGFGIIIGSFLNVFLYRFHTGKSLSGSSHCLSCATPLKSYELVPLLSYLCLRGRCRTCSAVIPSRYFLVELLTGLLFVAVILSFSNVVLIPLLLAFVSVLVVIAVYDLYHMIIPNELVLTLLVIAFLFQGYDLFLSADAAPFLMDVLVAFIGSVFLFTLWRMSDGKWVGFGDVKLAMPLGLMVGCGGVFSMLVLSFWIGAVIGLLLLALQKIRRRGQAHLRFLPQRLTMKSAVPFAPFLILGCLAVLFLGVDVISLLSYGY